MNAIIGDNGIITRAQEANMQSSIASLEEFLQLKYTENYEEMTKYQSKIEGLTNVYPNYFYIPSAEGIGALKYIIDSEGHALYLIKKSGLPEEIRESLVGGDAGTGSYADYQGLNDVYGVTANLKVYYCSDGVDSIKGLAKENLDNDNPLRQVFDADTNPGMYGLLETYDTDENGIITAEDVKKIKQLTIKGDSGITSLEDLFNFTGLEELILDGVTLENLNGIQNVNSLNYVFFKSSKIMNYSALGGNCKKIVYLYFYNINNDEINKFCSNVASFDFENLEYLGFFGLDKIWTADLLYGGDVKNNEKKSDLSDISSLSMLSEKTKNAVKYMYLHNNYIEKVSSLGEFSNLVLLYLQNNCIDSIDGLERIDALSYLCLEQNDLKNLPNFSENSNLIQINLKNNENLITLNGLSNCKKLYRIDAVNCDLGNSTDLSELEYSLKSLENKSELYQVDFSNNSNLVYVDSLLSCKNIKKLYLENCNNLSGTSLANIISIIRNCVEYKIPTKFSLALLDENTKGIRLNPSLDKDNFELLKSYPQIQSISLKNLVLTDADGVTLGDVEKNKTINDVLKSIPSLESVQLNSVKGLSSIEFCANCTNLRYLDLRDTSVTDLTILEDNCSKLNTLIINNTGTDLKTIPKTISRLGSSTNGNVSCVSYEGGQEFVAGLCCPTPSIWYSLSGGSSLDLKKINVQFTINVFATEQIIDLTGYSNLTDISIYNTQLILKLPKNCKNVSLTHIAAGEPCDFSEVESLSFLNVSLWQNNNTSSLEWFTAVSQCGGNIDSFKLVVSNQPSSAVLNIGSISNKVKILTIQGLGINVDLKTDSTSNILSQLQISSTRNAIGVKNFEYISKYKNLINLLINNSDLSGLRGIEELTNLQTLDLKNNSIYDRSSYVDSDGMEKTYYNLELISRLHPTNGGQLQKLYLSNNSGLLDFSYVENLNWTDWSGFKGK